MNSIRISKVPAAWAALVLLVLSACGTLTATPEAQNSALGTRSSILPVSSAPTRANIRVNQAASTAEVVHANAQATLNSADATIGVAQTQDQSNANIIAAQIASTAEIERAQAQATLVAAGSTQNAALTQDAIQQTQEADQATTGAAAVVNQQNKEDLAAGTQTAVANGVATQAQSAVATTQWFTDQARLRDEQRQVPIAFLWTWCLPTFIVLLAGLALWGFWRWLRIRQANQRIFDGLIEQEPRALPPNVVDHRHDEADSYLEGEDVGEHYHLTKPDDQVHGWLDEVKRKLRSGNQKDEDDDTGK